MSARSAHSALGRCLRLARHVDRAQQQRLAGGGVADLPGHGHRFLEHVLRHAGELAPSLECVEQEPSIAGGPRYPLVGIAHRFLCRRHIERLLERLGGTAVVGLRLERLCQRVQPRVQRVGESQLQIGQAIQHLDALLAQVRGLQLG
jgi:hypothetical protein